MSCHVLACLVMYWHILSICVTFCNFFTFHVMSYFFLSYLVIFSRDLSCLVPSCIFCLKIQCTTSCWHLTSLAQLWTSYCDNLNVFKTIFINQYRIPAIFSIFYHLSDHFYTIINKMGPDLVTGPVWLVLLIKVPDSITDPISDFVKNDCIFLYNKMCVPLARNVCAWLFAADQRFAVKNICCSAFIYIWGSSLSNVHSSPNNCQIEKYFLMFFWG